MKLEKPTKYKNTHTLAVLLTLSTFLAAVFISGCASSPHALQENKGQTETAQQPNADTGQNKTENADTRHQESIPVRLRFQAFPGNMICFFSQIPT